MKNLSAIDWIALVLVLVGGLNWGLLGFLKFNLVASIFGDLSILSGVIYSLVGLSAVHIAIQSSKFGKVN